MDSPNMKRISLYLDKKLVKKADSAKRKLGYSSRNEFFTVLIENIIANEMIKDNSDIEVFSVVERNQHKRVDVIRTYIYNKTQKYVVVLEPQMRNNANAYYLLTAYYLNEKYGEKQLKKKLKSKIDSVL